MKLKLKLKLKFIFFSLISFFPLTALAQPEYFYFGGAAGISTISALSQYLNGSNPLKEYDRTKESGFKFFAGIPVNPALAIEAQYTNFGRLNLSVNGLGHSLLNVTSSADSVSLGVVGKIPLPVLTPYGKFGVHRWDLDATSRLPEGISGLKTSSTRGVDAYYGAGIEFTPIPLVDFAIEYERYDFFLVNIDYVSAKIKFGF